MIHPKCYLAGLPMGMLSGLLLSGEPTPVPAQLKITSGIPSGAGLTLRLEGPETVEWRFLQSHNLRDWSPSSLVSPLYSHPTTPQPLTLTNLPRSPSLFVKALPTQGFYDPWVVREIEFKFEESDWARILTANYSTGAYLSGDLVYNGTLYPKVGVRYKGNTSFSRAGVKKSISMKVDHSDPTQELEGFETFNFNNAYDDESLMREVLYFNAMRKDVICPSAGYMRIFINGDYWGLYVNIQQENRDLLKTWFPTGQGDRWKAPSGTGGAPAQTNPAPPSPLQPLAGGLGRGDRALNYLGDSLRAYQSLYELHTQTTDTPWENLMQATKALQDIPSETFREEIEHYFAVDAWLWFLVYENLFTDDDSYWNKGADYGIFYDPESKRIFPIEHDGNEAFNVGDVTLNPLQGEGNANRPVISRFLAIPELKQRYLAHYRVALEEQFNPSTLFQKIEWTKALIEKSVEEDTKKGYTTRGFELDITALKNHVQRRYTYLRSHPQINAAEPRIHQVTPPANPLPGLSLAVTVLASPPENSNLLALHLYYRSEPNTAFHKTVMEGISDNVLPPFIYQGFLPPASLGTSYEYYIEAVADTPEKTASYAPAKAEHETFTTRIQPSNSNSLSLRINEVMADNTTTLRDPQGEYEDWIELYNPLSHPISLRGHTLSDDPLNLRKWFFPENLILQPFSYLLVWADDESGDTPGLHTNFKLSRAGETLFLIGPDTEGNPLLDELTFPLLRSDQAYGRPFQNPETPSPLSPPTPQRQNPAFP